MRAHGTKACYVFGPERGGDRSKGCRCEDCRGAVRAYERERNARIEPAYIGAQPAREHVAWLSTQGVGLKQIVKISGVSQGSIWKLMYGKDGKVSKRIRPATAQAILAVQPCDGAAGSRVPAGPVRAQVERLVAAGVPRVRIAERIGQNRALQIGAESVTRATADGIGAMVAELEAGTLVTTKRHRNGDRVIAPDGVEIVEQPALSDAELFISAMADMLEQRIDDRKWHAQAACRGRASWLFFPSRGDMETVKAAKKVCGACFVRAECLAANLSERDGIYGGLSGRERRTMRETAA